MKDIPTPTAREMEILKVLWEYGPSSVKAVHRFLGEKDPANRDLAYNTVQTLLRIMESKGLVDHEPEGRSFIYTPCFSRDDTSTRFLGQVLEQVFDGAVEDMMLSLLRTERISPAELERMHSLIADARRQRRHDEPKGEHK